MYKKTIKTLISIVVALIVILLLIYGISKSDFTNIKKYDEQDSVRTMLNKKLSDKKQISNNTEIKIQGDNIANLGNFTLTLSKNKQLSTNISLKFRNTKSKSWFSDSSAENEIIKKSHILRNSVINTLSDNPNTNMSNKIMKKNLTKELNRHLSDGEIEEIYFNKFIIK